MIEKSYGQELSPTEAEANLSKAKSLLDQAQSDFDYSNSCGRPMPPERPVS